jgi:hypothetical protein
LVPPSILEASIKITNEPPTGMQANLHKALDNFDQVTENGIEIFDQMSIKKILYRQLRSSAGTNLHRLYRSSAGTNLYRLYRSSAGTNLYRLHRSSAGTNLYPVLILFINNINPLPVKNCID